MTCDEALRQAWLAEDGEAAPAGAADHWAACASCRAMLEGRRRVQEEYARLGEPGPGTELRGRVLAAAGAPRRTIRQPRFWAAAAAAALLLGLVSFRREPARPAVPADTIRFDAPRESLESRIGALEREMGLELGIDTSYSPGKTSPADRWGIGTLRDRIEKLEKTLKAAGAEPSDPGRGKAPVPDAAGEAC